MNLFVGQEQRHRHREQACGQEGEGEGGMNRESSTEIVTPVCVKQITSMKLPITQGAQPGAL